MQKGRFSIYIHNKTQTKRRRCTCAGGRRKIDCAIACSLLLATRSDHHSSPTCPHSHTIQTQNIVAKLPFGSAVLLHSLLFASPQPAHFACQCLMTMMMMLHCHRRRRRPCASVLATAATLLAACLLLLLPSTSASMGQEEARMYDRNLQHFSPEGRIYQVRG